MTHPTRKISRNDFKNAATFDLDRVTFLDKLGEGKLSPCLVIWILLI
jgi:hypothetical protein